MYDRRPMEKYALHTLEQWCLYAKTKGKKGIKPPTKMSYWEQMAELVEQYDNDTGYVSDGEYYVDHYDGDISDEEAEEEEEEEEKEQEEEEAEEEEEAADDDDDDDDADDEYIPPAKEEEEEEDDDDDDDAAAENVEEEEAEDDEDDEAEEVADDDVADEEMDAKSILSEKAAAAGDDKEYKVENDPVQSYLRVASRSLVNVLTRQQEDEDNRDAYIIAQLNAAYPEVEAEKEEAEDEKPATSKKTKVVEDQDVNSLMMPKKKMRKTAHAK